MGSLYKRRRRNGSAGETWWAKYYVNGRPKRVSTGTDKRRKAELFLRSREGRIAENMPVLPRVDKVRYDEIAEDLRVYYRTSGERDVQEAEFRLKHLDPFFRGCRVADIGGAAIAKYTQARQDAGAAGGTINRELATLGRMLKLAYEYNKVFRVPIIHKVEEANPRSGFFERGQFEEVRKRLPDDLKVAVTLCYVVGWRKAEVMGLERRQVDLEAGTVRLDAGTTKNHDGRVVYLPPELKAALAGQMARVEKMQRRTGTICPLLFPKLTGGRAGRPRGDWRKRWARACEQAGAPGRLVHDLRRTAVRNMVNNGVSERVAMTITGHRTRNVFDRYHIVSPADLQEAARKLTGHT